MSKEKAQKKQSSSPSSRAWLIGGIVVAIVAAIAIGAYIWKTSSGTSSSLTTNGPVENRPLPDHGDKSLLQGVESFPNEGRDHVSSASELSYKTDLPTSGAHLPSPAPAGFYSEKIQPGLLVHSLEHGGVVIYYDPARLSNDVEKSLRAFVKAHLEMWAGVVVMPSPVHYDAPFILTAWTKMLKLENYDARVVQAFLAEYLGRGPENPVR
ncbi:DUF3105 domain-containing protein [Candidatus Acetothermia bacterium]|nr:DUF3105 domain-containing protein [Candidatus Acetothermia bacterium]